MHFLRDLHESLPGENQAEANNMSINNSKNLSKRGLLAWTGLIIGLVAAGLSLSFTIPLSTEEWFFVVLIPIPWAGVALAWKRPFIGGAVLIVSGLLMILLPLVFRNLSEELFVWGWLAVIFLVGQPLVASGILLILSWKEGRRPPDNGDVR